MANGFVRRYGFYPPTETITAIEGVVIVDLPPPGPVQGVPTGVVCVVGEAADMHTAVRVSTTGVVTTNPAPVEVFGGQDLVNAIGGFDERIGKFGGECGNLFAELRNKTFSRLVVSVVDLLVDSVSGSQGTIRVWRDLPTNASATVAQPVVPMAAGGLAAGREFQTGGGVRCRLAATVAFSDAMAYASGTDGDVTAAGAPAATQAFTAASGDFVNKGAAEGDILVVGVLSAAGAQGANAATYRVTGVNSATSLQVEKMAGTSFDWTTGGSLAWRLHVRATADSASADGAGHRLSTDSGYAVLARPLTATIATTTALTPVVVPTAATASSWDPLSGLTGKVHPSTGLTYDANVHAINPSANPVLRARYTAAIDTLLSDDYPARDVNVVVSARKDSTRIMPYLRSHVIAASARGLSRTAILSPAVDALTFSAVIGDSGAGVGANRSDRVDYAWPGAQTYIPEAINFTLATSDAKTTTDGILDTTGDTWLASVLSLLPPERNPGQSTDPIPRCLAPILGYARGTPRLGMPEFTQMRAVGICGLKMDRTAGPIFQSGVTTSLTSGEKNIARRRMADFIQDSLAARLASLVKQPMTQGVKDLAVGLTQAFLEELADPRNPRIDDFAPIDEKSGNTPTTLARGIFVLVIRVRTLASMDFIVLNTEIGEGVVVSRAA